MRFFYPKGQKIGDFKGKFSNAKPKPKMADSIRLNPSSKNLTRPDLGKIFLTQTHYYIRPLQYTQSSMKKAPIACDR